MSLDWTEGFKYKPLNKEIFEFRLIELLPSEDADGRLEVQIFCISLGSSVVFETVSYVWGDPSLTFEPTSLSYINIAPLGKNSARQLSQEFNITVRLAEALRNFRYKDIARRLWIDSVCINQNDDKEKSWQIQNMAKIYQKGSQSLLWLGLETDNCRAALNYLERWGQWGYQSEPQPWKRIGRSMISRKWTARQLERSLRLEESFDALLVKNPFWLRIWIVQEVVNSLRLLLLYMF